MCKCGVCAATLHVMGARCYVQTVRLAPAGSTQMHENLSTGALTLYKAGVEEIFTPMYFFVARKPAAPAGRAASRR